MRTFHPSLIALFICGMLLSLHTQAEAKRLPVYAQPWLVQSKSFCFMIFHLKASDVKKYLPAGLEPQLNDKGLVNAFFEIYETEKIAGLPTYKTAFIAVDIAGHPSRTGAPGHFAIWGKVDSENARAFFQQELGFPYQHADSFKIQASGTMLSGAIGPQNNPILNLNIAVAQGQSLTSEGAVNMLAMKPGAGLINTEVLYLSKGRKGKILTFAINAADDPALNLLKQSEAQFVWLGEDQIFTYSYALPAKNLP